MTPIRQWSMAARVLVVLAVVLVISYLGGCLGGTGIPGDEAVRIAREQIDFVPQHTNAEFGRKGFPPTAVWAVTFWIEAAMSMWNCDISASAVRVGCPNRASNFGPVMRRPAGYSKYSMFNR